MPELPEVETVRRGLAPVMEGGTLTAVEQRRPNLRFPFPDRFAARLQGRRIEALTRRAKYLSARLSGGESLIMHLGMSGSFRIEGATPGEFHHERSKSPAHDHVVFVFAAGSRIVYNDPRRFGFMLLADTTTIDRHPLFRDLGIEPLGDDFDAAILIHAFAGKRAPLKAALLDQKIIAGLGNIYVCEALHRARLSPLRAACDATPAKLRALAKAIRDVLSEAIEAGGSSLRDHRRTDGELGYFQHRFAVYDRENEPCARRGCGGTIGRETQSGRSSFFCATCQN